MFVIGLILILLSAGAAVAVLAGGTDEQAAMYGGSLNLPTLVVFLAGAATLLLFVMGLELVRSGTKKANQNRKNNKRLRKLEKSEQERRADSGETTAPAAEGGVPQASPQASPHGSTQDSTGRASGAPDPGTSAAPPAEGPYQTPPPPAR